MEPLLKHAGDLGAKMAHDVEQEIKNTNSQRINLIVAFALYYILNQLRR